MFDIIKSLNLVQILAIASPILAVLISIWLNEWLTNRRIVRQRKDDVLKMLIENRYDATKEEFLRAMNSIPVVFRDNRKVRSLQDDLYRKIDLENQRGVPGSEERDMLLQELIAEICHQLGYSKEITIEDIRKVFKI